MCWLVHKPAGKKIPEKYIKQAENHNKDGYGIAYHDGTELKTFKTLDADEFREELSKHDDTELVVHLRAASVGTVAEESIHPFPIRTGLLFHNGTFSSLRTHKGTCDLTGADESDTMAFAKMLRECKYEKIADILPLIQHMATKYVNRLLFFENGGTITFVNKDLGTEEDGIWYSNDYHIPPKTYVTSGKTKVFVYGTLKTGYGNNARLLSTSRLLGKATTCLKFYMIGKDRAFPYVLGSEWEHYKREESGHKIVGEVYEVDGHVLAKLDALEGEPTHYHKKDIMVTLDGKDSTMMAKMYIKTNVTDKDFEEEMLEEWTGKTYKEPETEPEDATPFDADDVPSVPDDFAYYSYDALKDLSDDELRTIYIDQHTMLYSARPLSQLIPSKRLQIIKDILNFSDELLDRYIAQVTEE